MPLSLTLLRVANPQALRADNVYLVHKPGNKTWFVLRLEKVGDSLRWIDHRKSVVLYSADDVVYENPEHAYKRELVVAGTTT